MKQLKFLFFFSSLFCGFFISGAYIYYLYKYPKFPDTDHLLTYYSKDFLLKTGAFLNPPDKRIQHFLNFSALKKKNTIRIGAFGDSFTFGNEVNKNASYPHQLQQLFKKRFPNKKIEILNFGTPGGGLQEQFFLWDKYSKSYGIDYILFGPRGFYSDRNLTFRRNWDETYFMYPSERFVLSNKELKQVSITGDSLQERYRNYYKLIPSWTALRYDKAPFQIWGLFSPHLKYLPNPFYYTKLSDQEESDRINTLLLERIKKRYSKKILFFTDDESLFKNYSFVGQGYNLNFIKQTENIFYKMFDHKSSLGNESFANIYFNALIGKNQFTLPVISCDFSNTESNNQVYLKEELYQMKSIEIYIKSSPVFSLVQNSSDHDNYKLKRSYLNNKIKNTKSFLGLSNQSDFFKFPFFPLSIELKTGMTVYLLSNGKEKIELGKIQALDSFGKFFVFYANFIKAERDEKYTFYESYFLLEQIPHFLKQKIKNTKKPIELFVDDYKLGALDFHNFYGERQKSLRINPVNGYNKSFLMMKLPQAFKAKDFPKNFSLSIQYKATNNKVFKGSILHWKCKKRNQPFALKLPNFKSLF